jgi:D-alanyl-D-alanine-carboxypeptidase/D-alanyl-D-alanine-endopeptidase
MQRWLWSLVLAAAVAAAACGHSAPPAKPPPVAVDTSHFREPVEAQVQPFLDDELVSGLVIGLYDAGRTEVHGFGKGPGQGPPDGATLFELGSITNVYTALLLADAVQRREVELDTPVSELLPPGVTVPIRDKVPITLRHLALHSSGLPQQPPSLVARAGAADPYAGYGESALYNDLIHTDLDATPGAQIAYSPYGSALLGTALGRKIGGGYAGALASRVLVPLAMHDTFVGGAAAPAARRAAGTSDDLARVPPWTFDAMAAAGAVVSSAHDLLQLIDAELDAATGSDAPLRRAMKLTQEPALDRPGNNVGLGWLVDGAGRYWRNAGTGGFHAFISFDPRTRRGVVVLASTATSVIDRLVDAMYKVLEGQPPPPPRFATAAELAALAGSYDLNHTPLQVVVEGKRLYLAGSGEPRQRLCSISDHEFWLESLQSRAEFQKDGDKVARIVFHVGDHTLIAPRVETK